MSEDVTDRVREDTRHEPSDASPRLVFLLMTAVGATVIVAVIILSLVYHGPINPPSTAPHVLPPEPRLQVDEQADLQQFRAQVEKRLNSYGWVDQGHGIVHIPIAEAMRRAAAEGFPGWPGNKR